MYTEMITVSLLVLYIHVYIIYQNPDEAAKHQKNHPFFIKFVARPSTEAYIEGLCNSLQSLFMGSSVQRPRIKR